MSKNVRNDLALTVTSLTINNVTINTTNNASYTLTLPSNTGTNGQVLTTNGSGVLSWTTVAAGSGGTVTSVAATVPAFLSAAVVNPTTTPSVNITLSGTALPVANGGTGVTTSTGTGSVVLSINPALTSMTLSTPLGTPSGGTGLSTVGTSGQYLSSNGSTLVWVDPSSGTGSVISVSLTVDSSLTGVFTNTGTGTITESGTFTLSQASSPTFNLSGPNAVIVTNDSATDQAPFILSMPNMGNNTLCRIDIGKIRDFTGGGGIIEYQRKTSDTDANNCLLIGCGAGSYLTLRNGNGATLSGSLTVTGQISSGVSTGTAPLVVSSTTNVANLNASSLNGATFSAPGPIGSATPSTGSFTTLSVSTPIPITSGGTGSSTAQGTGQVVLATSPTLTTPNIGVATGASLEVSGNLIGGTLRSSTTIPVTDQGAILSWNRAHTTNGATFLMNQKGAGTGGIYLGTVTTSDVFTEQMSISDGGVVNIVNLTASKVLGTDGSKNLVSLSETGTGNIVLATSPTLVTPNIGAATGTSLSLSIPLGPGSGGTGLSTVGSNNQVLTIVGGVPAWATPSSPGTGTVTSVSATVPSFLTVSSSPVTTSGNIVIDYSGTALPVPNGGTGTTTSTGTGSVVLSISPTLTNPNIGSATGTSLITSGYITGGSVRAINPLAVSEQGAFLSWNRTYTTNGATFLMNQKGLGSGGIYIGTVTQSDVFTEQMRISDAGVVNINNLNASSVVGTDASKNLISASTTGTGNVVLASGPSLFNPILSGTLPLDSIYFPTTFTGSSKISFFGVAPNDNQFDGFGSIIGGVKCQIASTSNNFVFQAANNSSSSTEVFRVKGSGGFVSTGNSSITGNIAVFGNQTMTGNLSMGGNLTAVPIWGYGLQGIDQAVSSGGEAVVSSFTNLGIITSPGLTASSSGYQNLTGETVSALFTYSVFWDPAVGGGVVQACVRKNGDNNLRFGASSATVFSSTYFASCTGSAMVSLANGDYVELWVRNNLGGTLSLKGGSGSIPSITQLYYYRLN